MHNVCVCVYEGINECMYSLSVYIKSMFICLAYSMRCSLWYSNVVKQIPKAFREKRDAFLLLLKVTLSPCHSILLKYPYIVPPYIWATGGGYIIEILMDESGDSPLSCSLQILHRAMTELSESNYCRKAEYIEYNLIVGSAAFSCFSPSLKIAHWLSLFRHFIPYWRNRKQLKCTACQGFGVMKWNYTNTNAIIN